MRTRQERTNHENTFHRALHSRSLLVVEVILLVLVGVALGKEVVIRYSIQREISQLQKQYQDLQGSNVEIGSVISYLESDTYAEEQARSKLGLKKEGESVILLPQDTQIAEQSSSQSATESATQDAQSNTTRWWDYFFRNITS